MKKYVILCSLAMIVFESLGALFSWSGVSITTGDEVSSQGTLVDSLNLNGATLTAYGVEFSDTATMMSHGAIWNTSGLYSGSLDATFAAIMNTVGFHDAIAGDLIVDLSGLSMGQEYEIQLFFADDRDTAVVGRRVLVGGLDMVYAAPDPLVLTGIFTADALTQSLTVDFLDAVGDPVGQHLSAYQLRAIPEPVTIGLIAGVGSGLIWIRRRFMI